MKETNRDKLKPIIAGIIEEVGTEDPTKLRQALIEGYPGEKRKSYLYKVWLSEIKIQLKKAPPLGTKRGGARCPDTLDMFG